VVIEISKNGAHPPTGRVTGAKSSAPQWCQFKGMLQAAVQTAGQFFQSYLSALPEFAVEPDEDLEEIEGQHENQQPGDDGHGVVMGTCSR
jgi:hypothetical protein